MGGELKRFTLTAAHVKLLRRTNVVWLDREGGAPCIDTKRPYGNSDYLRDIAEILGAALFEDAGGERHLGPTQAARFERLHRETETALAVVLATGSFEPGEYVADQYDRNWRRAG